MPVARVDEPSADDGDAIRTGRLAPARNARSSVAGLGHGALSRRDRLLGSGGELRDGREASRVRHGPLPRSLTSSAGKVAQSSPDSWARGASYPPGAAGRQRPAALATSEPLPLVSVPRSRAIPGRPGLELACPGVVPARAKDRPRAAAHGRIGLGSERAPDRTHVGAGTGVVVTGQIASGGLARCPWQAVARWARERAMR